MDIYDITQENIIDWAQNYANYDELEQTAKAIYSIYVLTRKQKQPEKHTHKPKNKKSFRYPKGYRKYEKPLEQNKVIPITEYRR